ncbi:DUF4912 domain-containing protein [Trichothermofontia sichuanensis B231]|uniref:DUF4912 domain-containing protein n=1 Tax=Trichothermofontia sichuanensis TaxID=3045816 RepID=UPI002247CA39|nr:DUF4912 domain-containing protein [Trichothermofontia sichuanensis B231]
MSKQGPPLEEMTLRQLRRVASECGISRYSRMRKAQLLAAIQAVQGASPTPIPPPTSPTVTPLTPSVSLQPVAPPGSQPIVPTSPPGVTLTPQAGTVTPIAATPSQTVQPQPPTVTPRRTAIPPEMTPAPRAVTPPGTPQPQPSESVPPPPPTGTTAQPPAAAIAPLPTAATEVAGPSGPPSAEPLEAQEAVEAAKFDVGQTAPIEAELATVDEGLPDLPGGYGESRIVLLPRDPQWAYVYWDVPNEHREELRQQGGQQLALRLYDVTAIDLTVQPPHRMQEYPCDELAREWYVPIPMSDRDYIAEIGYRCWDGRWLILARSLSTHMPPIYPSDWIEDNFITIGWEESLQGRTFFRLVPPPTREPGTEGIAQQIYDLAQAAAAQRLAGSLFGSMQHVAGSIFGSVHLAERAVSSYVFPSGVGLWASGVGMFSASAPPLRSRKFWLVADAELIVYGATEPDATVTIAGQPVRLNPDGTFRIQVSFPDGLIDYPIMAIAADGEQSRSIHLRFQRDTPSQQTNTKEAAIAEWLA